MFRVHRDPDNLERRLRDLPGECVHLTLDGDHLVAGPVGVFLLGEADDLHDRSEELILRANRIRAALAETMVWVPFIQPLVVSKVESPRLDPFRMPTCPVVTPSLVLPAVAHGTPQLPPVVLAELTRCCRRLTEPAAPIPAYR